MGSARSKVGSGLARRRPASVYLLATAAAAMFMAAGGMTGGSCNVPQPPGNSNGNGNGTGNTGGPQITSSDHVLGNASAPVTVVEYSDLECPFCGRFARQEFPTFKANYIDTGKVRFVYRHFPLNNIHPRAQPAAEASECAADQVDFYAYIEEVFSNSSDTSTLSDQSLRDYATGLGASGATFDSCFSSNSKAARVQQDINSGGALGVSSTPTFFVNSRRIAGFQTAAQLGAAVDQEMGG